MKAADKLASLVECPDLRAGFRSLLDVGSYYSAAPGRYLDTFMSALRLLPDLENHVIHRKDKTLLKRAAVERLNEEHDFNFRETRLIDELKGTEGELLWSMWGWQLTTSEGESSGRHDYFEEDILGQAAMVESMINWIEDDTYAMPLCLDNALADFEIVMGMYQSIIHNNTTGFPLQPEPDILGKIREHLKSLHPHQPRLPSRHQPGRQKEFPNRNPHPSPGD